MNYNFINKKLSGIIKDSKTDKEALEVYLEGQENSFILKHNIDAISFVLNFLSGNENICILNGFMGSGKTYCIDLITDFVDDNVLTFKNSYQEAINPDDVFLSMFKDFSVYYNDRKIILPKIDTPIFSEKINAYVKYCNVPMLFIFDSFEINMRTKDSQKDILDFINYISRFEKVKIIIASRTFKKSNLIKDVSAVDTYLNSLSEENLVEYLNENNITGSRYEFDQLYKETRGHFVLLEYSVLIMNLLGLNLSLFLSEYKKSSKNILEFLIFKLLSTASDKFMKVLLFLSVIRHGVSIDFILTEEIASMDDLEFLFQKRIISEKYGKIYMKDYLKAEFIKSVNNETKIKAHEYASQLYSAELPLKPFERLMFLSRQTMRQEIQYHREKIENLNDLLIKAGITRQTDSQGINYVSYSKMGGFDNKKSNRGVRQKKYLRELRNKDNFLYSNINTEDNLSKKMIEISKPSNEKNFVDVKNSNENVPKSLQDYINIAQEYENAFNFSSAIQYYKKALDYQEDENFAEEEPKIYEKLALCYKKIQDTDSAVQYYEKVYQIYKRNNVKNPESVLLNIARMYTEVYKIDQAQEVYKKILFSDSEIDFALKVRIYLELSDIYDNNMDYPQAAKYIAAALKEAEKMSDIGLLSECYYKYALILHDSGNTELATKYYLRCIQISNNTEENLYTSSAYSNLADISADKNNINAAKKYWELAIEFDKKQNNTEGLYYSYSKLALLYKKENPQKTHELLLKALSAAKRFDDVSYAVAIYIEIGDYYVSLHDFKHALKSYLLAQNLIPEHSQDEINSKLKSKINKIKVLSGETTFLSMLNDIKKKR